MPHSSARLVQWLLATVLLVWGVRALMPDHALASYAVLNGIVDSETFWGTLATGVGFTRLVALWEDSRQVSWRPFWYRVRAVTGVLSLMGWTLMGVLLLLTNPLTEPSPGSWTYPIYAVFELIAARRAAIEERVA